MTELAKKEADIFGLRLSLSIPVYFDPIVPDLVRLTDHLILMAYERTSIDRILRDLEVELRAIPTKQMSIALRPQDFDSLDQLYAFMDELDQRTGSARFVLHDYKSLRLK
ncbi:hypothetical protein RZS08_40500, partial [Arthrospira platensis SPKY1]|nr:hypothetical protein [Arthrospira platensis SPKY1]